MRQTSFRSLLATSMVTLAAALTLAASPAGAAPPPSPTPATSDCSVQPRRSVFPELLLAGETATVTLGLGVACPQSLSPLHLVLVLDSSASLSEEAARRITDSARRVLQQLVKVGSPPPRFGIVSFNHSARIRCPLTDDSARLDACLSHLRPSGGRAIERGLQMGLKTLQAGHALRTRRYTPIDVMILIASGNNDRGCGEAQRMARRVKDAGVLLMTLGVDRTTDVTCLRTLASSPRYHFDDVEALLPIFEPVHYTLRSSRRLLRRLELVETLAPGIALIEGSAAPAATLSDDGRSLSWSFAPVEDKGITVTYRVRPLAPGRLVGSSGSRADFVDSLNFPGGLDLPPAWLTVLAPTDRP